MSKKIVNLFIVGLGNQFSKHLIYTIHSNKDSVFIKGICDINEEKMEIACDNNLQKLGFKEIPTKFKIFNEILTFAESNISKEKNVFIISTPPKYHFE